MTERSGSTGDGGEQSERTESPHRVLFVTGKLAEPALRRVLTDMAPPFAYDVAVLGITVAALMTTPWIARHLDAPANDTDLVLIPGLCEGDPDIVRQKVGVRVEKGPKDLREIPSYFGRHVPRDYGTWDIEIVAEINNVPRLTREETRRVAEYFRESGADVIDIGCTPGLPFPALGDIVRELVSAGMRVSVDSFDVGEIRTAVAAGAELVLSVNGSNLDVIPDLAAAGARAVVVPDAGASLDSLDRHARRARCGGRSLSHRSGDRADRLRVHGVARAVCGGAPPLSRRRDDDGHWQYHGADRGRLHGRERAPHRRLPGARDSHGAHHGSDSLGERCRARSGPSLASSCTTPCVDARSRSTSTIVSSR